MVFVGGCGRCYGRWPLEMLGNSECWRMRMLDDMVPRDLFDSVGKNGKRVERFLSLLGQIPELFKSGLKQSKESQDKEKSDPSYLCLNIEPASRSFSGYFRNPKSPAEVLRIAPELFEIHKQRALEARKAQEWRWLLNSVGASLHCIMCKIYRAEMHVAHSDLHVLHDTTEEPWVSSGKRRMLHPTCWSRWLMRLRTQNFCGDSCPKLVFLCSSVTWSQGLEVVAKNRVPHASPSSVAEGMSGWS